ncbi:hypothetical protein FDI26_gp43 [Arthrobacter phage Beans]|uniref:Uncharacterized protein n=1 Tax=Arthrobacter phage Beans TaxID=2015815 RepID=A0A222ZJS8_9CAUD|nr:hypothetical protein FDI26_gp43 [Arthrobacter phage Beans]ASR84718.1 hypothetical protein SEA_BEANS_43 [Arthrobacter phage Beans]
MTMKFEDLPESVQAQLHDELLHEEPGQRTAAEQELARLQAEVEARELAAETPEQAQERFDKAQAEAAGVPLDFAQLYSKVEAEIDDVIPGEDQSLATATAAVIQLVSTYCAAAAEHNQAALKHRYESALTGLRHLMVKENYGQLLVDDEDVARASQATPPLVVERLVSQKRTRYIIEHPAGRDV